MDSMDSTDSFDEFEFTPITEGLGFHKKPVKLEKTPEAPPTPLQRKTEIPPPLAAKLRSNIDFVGPERASEPKLKAPLPRPGEIAKPTVAPAASAAFTMPKAQPKPTSIPQAAKPIAAHLAAGLVDGVLVIAVGIIFLVALLVVTKVDLMAVLTSSEIDHLTQISLIVLFATVLQLYIVASRSFFGSTIGDWAFDVALGKPEQQERWSFPFLVLWRSVVVTATGIILLPLMSAIVRQDLAYYLTGLQLYRNEF